jgi:hypothetical protein
MAPARGWERLSAARTALVSFSFQSVRSSSRSMPIPDERPTASQILPLVFRLFPVFDIVAGSLFEHGLSMFSPSRQAWK